MTDGQLERLETLDQWVERWSKRVGLVGFRSREERVQRYFAEAIAAARFLPSGRASMEALDLGSGGGSPALPLAIVRPDWHWTLVESRRKKCLFLEEAARALGLASVRVIAERFEAIEEVALVDAITVRGVRMSRALLERSSCWLRPEGRVLWFSGEERLEAVSLGLEAFSLVPVEGPLRLLPGARGSILILEKDEGSAQR